MEERQKLKDRIGLEISDMNFNHHTFCQNKLNFIILAFQFFNCIVSLLISAITPFSIGIYGATINLVLMLVVLLNIKVCNRAWEEAKKHQNIILAMYDIIDNMDLSIEDVEFHLSKLKGYNIKHSDTKLEILINKWYKNIDVKKREVTPYKDKKGNYYSVGDIVLNPFMGDLWLVEKIDEEKMAEYDVEIPYVFTLYGDPDEYVLALNDPEGFEIVSTPTEVRNYVLYLAIFNQAYTMYKAEYEYNSKEVVNNEEEEVGTDQIDE